MSRCHLGQCAGTEAFTLARIMQSLNAQRETTTMPTRFLSAFFLSFLVVALFGWKWDGTKKKRAVKEKRGEACKFFLGQKKRVFHSTKKYERYEQSILCSLVLFVDNISPLNVAKGETAALTRHEMTGRITRIFHSRNLLSTEREW